MVLDRNERRPGEIGRKNLEQHVHHGLGGLVEDRVVDIAGLEEEIARAIDDGLVRQHVGHIAGRHLADAGADVVVLADIDRKSTRLNSSHLGISYAVFCLKKKKEECTNRTSTRYIPR